MDARKKECPVLSSFRVLFGCVQPTRMGEEISDATTAASTEAEHL